MDLRRFIKKCLTDPPAAWRSVKLVSRNFYSHCYWKLSPNRPLLHRLSNGGILLLEPGHSFTYCFYPGVDTYEPDVQLALQFLLKPGNIFIDCGANVGFFSVQAAQLVGNTGNVIAIEANPLTYSFLKRNLVANKFGVPVNCAVTTQIGEVELFMPNDGGDVYSSLKQGGLLQGKSVQSFKVQGRSLDEVVLELALPRVDVVKIDVEGAELEVLCSSNHLLSNLRPIFITEYSSKTWPGFGSTPEDLQALINKYDYKLNLFDFHTKGLVPLPEGIWQSSYVNLVLVPEERLGEFL